jgi:cobalamin biosynthesis Mg chelatase CobN
VSLRRLPALALLVCVGWLTWGSAPVGAQIFPTTTSTSQPSSTTTPTIRPTTTTRPSTTTSRPGSTTSSTGQDTTSTSGRSSTTTTATTIATPRSTVPLLPPVSLSPAEAEEAPPEAQGSGDISAAFPVLSFLGFAVAVAMMGIRWWQTRS